MNQRHEPSWFGQWATAWDSFWFTPRSATIPGLMRCLVGLMAFYTLAVWTPVLNSFFGPDPMIPTEYRTLLFDSSLAWSHLDWFASSPTMLMVVHVVGLLIVLAFTLGMGVRVTGVLTALLVISYANRATGMLFGLDQILAFLALYLALANSGDAFSPVRWWRGRQADEGCSDATGLGATVGNNIAIRLTQIHLCVVYLFAGLGKCQGESWWNGEAIWGALASYEYQTLDMTWIANHMWLVGLITLVTLAFEVSYVALIWSRLTRPVMLLLAIPLHLGIGICMGMMTFALIMLIANVAFVPERWMDRWRPVSN